MSLATRQAAEEKQLKILLKNIEEVDNFNKLIETLRNFELWYPGIAVKHLPSALSSYLKTEV